MALPCPHAHSGRIEALKREIGSTARRNAGNEPDDIQIIDILGEGSYGKVYKGECVLQCTRCVLLHTAQRSPPPALRTWHRGPTPPPSCSAHLAPRFQRSLAKTG